MITQICTGDILAICRRFVPNFRWIVSLPVNFAPMQRQGGEVITEGSGMHSLIRCVGLIDYSPHVHFDREFQYWYTCTRIYLYSCMYCTSTGYQYICEIGVWSCPCVTAHPFFVRTLHNYIFLKSSRSGLSSAAQYVFSRAHSDPIFHMDVLQSVY